MSLNKIACCLLIRQGEDPWPLVRSYNNTYRGHPHNFFFVCKGDLPFVVHGHPIRVSDWGYDLRAYRKAAEQLTEYDGLFFANGYTRWHEHHWLQRMVAAMTPEVGLVGAQSSTTSFYTNRPVWWRKLLFPPAPNFHVRTNAFLIRRELMLKVWPRFTPFKWSCHLAESGRWSITRRIQAAGWRVVVEDFGITDNRNLTTSHERANTPDPLQPQLDGRISPS